MDVIVMQVFVSLVLVIGGVLRRLGVGSSLRMGED